MEERRGNTNTRRGLTGLGSRMRVSSSAKAAAERRERWVRGGERVGDWGCM